MDWTARIHYPNTILRAVVGSTAHGLNVKDGVEDRDEMGVLIEGLPAAMGFHPFEQHIYRTAAIREGKQDARSREGDLDLIVYSLKKYLRLALKANPTILILLFSTPEQCVVRTKVGEELQALAQHIVSKKAASTFLGYLTAQKQRLLGERGQKRIHRPELEELYGFDTKYAMHMLRLGIQGKELLTNGRLTLPIPEPERVWLYDVRTGGVSLQECLTEAGYLENELKELKETSPLPDEPNEALVQEWMLDTYMDAWRKDERVRA